MNQAAEPRENQETLEGYVVDLACIRHYPRGECAARARVHTRECALMGHCVESGYGLIDEEGRMYVLDQEATLPVVEMLRNSHRERGIKARVYRERQGSKMQTRHVEEVPPG